MSESERSLAIHPDTNVAIESPPSRPESAGAGVPPLGGVSSLRAFASLGSFEVRMLIVRDDNSDQSETKRNFSSCRLLPEVSSLGPQACHYLLLSVIFSEKIETRFLAKWKLV